MTDATELDEAAIRARLEAATEQVGRLHPDARPKSPNDRQRSAIAASLADVPLLLAALTSARKEVERLTEEHRDLVRRLGFGDNTTEPMADNDTVVAWIEEQVAEAGEWRESQRWRDECIAAGHRDDEDCWEHDPARRLEAAEVKAEAGVRVAHIALAAESDVERLRAVVERVEALAEEWACDDPGCDREGGDFIRASLDPAVPATEGGEESNQAGHHLLAAECRRDNCAEVHYARQLPDPTTLDTTPEGDRA